MQKSTDTNDHVSNGNDAESMRIGPNLSENVGPSGLDGFPFDIDGVCEAYMNIYGFTENRTEPKDNSDDGGGVREEDKEISRSIPTRAEPDNGNDDLGVHEEDIPPNDIKMGRGRKLQQHPGNIWFRNLIAKRFDKFEKLGKSQKSKMIKNVYNDIIEQNRKFWNKKRGWTVLDTKSAGKKIAYTFRSIRKKEKEFFDRKKKERDDREEIEFKPLSPQSPDHQLHPQDAKMILGAFPFEHTG